MLRRGLEEARSTPTPIQITEEADLVHLSDELVDVRFPVTKVTTLDVVLEFACPPTAVGVGKLEGPQEVGCLWQSLNIRISEYAQLLRYSPA